MANDTTSAVTVIGELFALSMAPSHSSSLGPLGGVLIAMAPGHSTSPGLFGGTVVRNSSGRYVSHEEAAVHGVTHICEQIWTYLFG